HIAERYTAHTRLSQRPRASLAKVLALHGATSITSAQRPISTWLFHCEPSLTLLNTGCFETVSSASGLTKAPAEDVIITLTSAPAFISWRTRMGVLYAAILPVTASMIFFP